MKPAQTTLKEDWIYLWKVGCKKITINKIGIFFDHNIPAFKYGIGFACQWQKTPLTDMSMPDKEAEEWYDSNHDKVK